MGGYASKMRWTGKTASRDAGTRSRPQVPAVKPWDSYALAVETKVRLPNVYSPKRTSMSDGGRRKRTRDAIFFIYPLDKQQVG